MEKVIEMYGKKIEMENEVREAKCHAPIPGPTRLANRTGFGVRNHILGHFTFFFFFFFSELNLYLWVYK